MVARWYHAPDGSDLCSDCAGILGSQLPDVAQALELHTGTQPPKCKGCGRGGRA